MLNHKSRGAIALGLSSALYLSPALANQDEEIQELRAQLEELETLVLDLEDKTGGNAISKAFDAVNMNIGGYYHGNATQFSLTNPDGGDGGDIQGFARNLIYLRIEADINEKWSASFGHLYGNVHNETPERAGVESIITEGVTDGITEVANAAVSSFFAGTTINPSNVEASTGDLINNQFGDSFESLSLNFAVDANLKYKHNDSLEVTFGRQRTPAGYRSRQIYPLSWRVPELPRFLLGQNGVTNVYSPFMQGISAQGKFFPSAGDYILNYSVFHGDLISPLTSVNDGTVHNEQYGARVAFGLANQSFDFGLNYIAGKRENPGGSNALYGGNRFDAFGADLYMNNRYLQLIAEFYSTNEGQDVSGSNVPDKTAFIIQPSFHVTDKVDFFISYDLIDAPLYISNGLSAVVSAALTTPESQAGIAQAIAAAETAIMQPANTLTAGTPGGVAVYSPSHLGEITETFAGFYIKPTDEVAIRIGHGTREYKDIGNTEIDITYFSATASF